MIIDLKVVSRELLDSADLMTDQVFYIYDLLKVIMVSKNKNLFIGKLFLIDQDALSRSDLPIL